MMENKKSLAIIVSEAAKIEEILIESQGEMNEEIEAFLAVNSKELAEKADAYFLVMERFSALEKHYKERADFFSIVSKQCKNVQERLKNNIKDAMQNLNADEIEGVDIRFKLSRSKPSLEIIEQDAIPREYFKEKTEIVLDKERLKEDLSIGPVSGAVLKESFALRAYANTKKIESKK